MKDKDKLLYGIEVLEALLLLLENSHTSVDTEMDLENNTQSQLMIKSSPAILEEFTQTIYREDFRVGLEPKVSSIRESLAYLKELWMELFDKETYERGLAYQKAAEEIEEFKKKRDKILSEKELRKKEEEFFKQIVESKQAPLESDNPFDDIVPVQKRDKMRAKREVMLQAQKELEEAQEEAVERFVRSRDLLDERE